MDLRSTLSAVADYVPGDVENVLAAASAYLPDDLEKAISGAASYIPTEISLGSTVQFMLFFAAASLILGFMGRVFLGKRSSLNHSLSAAMGILFIYAVAIVVYNFKPWSLDALLSPLPFVRFAGEHLLVIPFQRSPLTIVCSEILSLVILAFLVNLLDTLIPRGKSALGWFFLRILTVLFAMVLHILVDWAFKTYLPNVLVTYAPTILLVILAVTLLMGLHHRQAAEQGRVHLRHYLRRGVPAGILRLYGDLRQRRRPFCVYSPGHCSAAVVVLNWLGFVISKTLPSAGKRRVFDFFRQLC